MFRGLRKVFSKGHSSEVESLEVDTTQFDEPVAVRPKAKTAQPVAPSNDLPTSSGEAARIAASASNPGPQVTASSGGKTAWNFSDLGEHSSAPRPPPKAGASALSASPPIPTPGASSQNNRSASNPSAPAHSPVSGAAWGTTASPEKEQARSPPEKEAAKHQSKLGGLFRSGSKNARSSADGNTAVEAMGNLQDDKPSVMGGNMHANYHASPPSKGGLLDGDNFQPAGRGGALRAGTFVATPMTVETRRGSAVLG